MSRVACIHRLRRLGLGSVRVRSAVAAALVVALATAIGASVFLYLYDAQLVAGGSTQSSVRGGLAEHTIVQD